jgi:hypothetical protein
LVEGDIRDALLGFRVGRDSGDQRLSLHPPEPAEAQIKEVTSTH